MNHTQQSYPALRTRLLAMTALAGLSAALTIPATEANAAGFALKEQSASAQGNSFAGATAGAEDVSYMFFNPAGLTRHKDNQATAVLSSIWLTAETNNADGGTTGAASEDGGKTALVPAVYGMWSISSDLKIGLGVNVPFGLATEYSPTWQGRYYAVESRIQTVNINPALAYRVSPNLSLAVGIQAEKFDVTLSNVVPGAEALFEVEGDDWDYGFNLGVMYEFSADTRVGLSYRSQIEHDVSGNAFLGVPANNTAVNADITLPDTAQIGVYHDYSREFAVMGEIGWTGWSTLDQLQVNLASDIGLGTTTIAQPYNWDDAWFVALGATWRPNDRWTVRGGAAFDQSPIPDETRTPRLPGEDRTWLSLGASYSPVPAFSINAAYTHIFIQDSAVDIQSGPLPQLTADFENAVDILTIQGVVRF